jgi:hypothetical protein
MNQPFVQEEMQSFSTTCHPAVSGEISSMVLRVADWQSDDRWDRLEMAENSLSREGALEQIEHDANHEASLAVTE